MSRSRRVLVTGAAGFTGRHLTRALVARGVRVFGLTEHAGEALGEDVEPVVADLRDADSLAAAVAHAAPAQVVHLAAISFPGHADAAAMYRVNLDGTLALLQALLAGGHGREGVLLPSTATVYAPASVPLTEDAPLQPGSHYAVSKLAMEHMARLFAARLPIVLVRPFNYTGPGQREPFLVPKIVRHFAQRADTIELGNVDVERDFTDVRVVVDAYCRLLETPAAAGQMFNVCSGRATAVRSIVTTLEAMTGHAMTIRVNPAFVRAGEPARITGSAARLTATIGPLLDVPLGETLGAMLEAVRGA
ncbi:MAG: NAD-dependent epimerase/dehydratase family protein [Burkholderiales bacterium]